MGKRSAGYALEVMLLQSVFCQFLVFGAGATIVGIGIDADATARGEESCHFNIFGVHQPDEVLHDDVDAVLMEVAVVAEAEEVEFETLAFHHFLAREIGNSDFREVGLSGDGAEAGEFGTVETHPIVVAWVLVVKRFEHFGCIVAFVFCFAAKGLQAEVFSHDVCDGDV